MAVEPERRCGFRKVGGLYLCGSGHGMECDRLPYELKVCPVCGSGVKFSRGFQWLDWYKYAGKHGDKFDHAALSEFEFCTCQLTCPVCHPEMCTSLIIEKRQPYGLLWVGESFYTPESFIQESIQMGVSKRIAAIPKNLKLGETLVLFAHIRACGERRSEEPPFKVEGIPGVFYAFRPQRLELLIWKSQATPDYIAELVKKNITSIIIPDGDIEHNPRTSLKPKAEEKDKLLFDSLREKLRS